MTETTLRELAKEAATFDDLADQLTDAHDDGGDDWIAGPLASGGRWVARANHNYQPPEGRLNRPVNVEIFHADGEEEVTP